MKNWKCIPVVAIVSLLLAACGTNDPNHLAQNELRDEVMAVHDEVMPKMGEIHRLKKELRKISDLDELVGDHPIAAMLLQLEKPTRA